MTRATARPVRTTPSTLPADLHAPANTYFPGRLPTISFMIVFRAMPVIRETERIELPSHSADHACTHPQQSCGPYPERGQGT